MSPQIHLVDRPLSVAQGPLVAHGLSVVYDGKPALWNVDFTAPAGALVGVIGERSRQKFLHQSFARSGAMGQRLGDAVGRSAKAWPRPRRLCAAASQRRLGFSG